jgi:cytochrome c-type biogenesis protein
MVQLFLFPGGFMYADISILAAFSAGILSFLSPCVLPLVPAYLSYLVSGTEAQRMRKTLLLRSLLFILGFSVVFIGLGASASLLGKLLSSHRSLLRELSGLAMIFFGLHMMGILKLAWLYKEKRLEYNPKNGATSLSAFFLGVVFAAGWTPCIGPILSSILVYASSAATVNQGVVLLAVYSLGLGVPFFISALLAQGLGVKLSRFNRYMPYVTKASGVLMIVLGYLIFNNKLAVLNSYFQFTQY